MDKKTSTTKKASTAKKTTTVKKATPVKKTAPAKKATTVKKASAPKKVSTEPKKVEVVETAPKKDNKLESLFNYYFFQGIIGSVIAFAIGVFLISKPAIANRTAEIFTAVIFIAVGLCALFSHAFKEKISLLRFSLVFGIISIVLGTLIILNPFTLTNMLTIVFGIFLLINGLLKVDKAIKLRGINEASWTLLLTMGIINIVFGFIIMFYRFANLFFTQTVGLFMILYGIMEFTEMVLLKQRSKSFLNLLK